MGLLFLTLYANNPRKVWFEHHKYQANSTYSKEMKQDLFVTLNCLQMKTFPSRILFLTEWCRIQSKIDDISVPVMPNEVKSDILQVVIKCDPMMVTTFSNYKQLCVMQNLPAAIPFKDLYQRVQSAFITLDRISPLAFARSSNVSDSTNSIAAFANFLINHGASDTIINEFCHTFATNATLTANAARRDCQHQP